VNGRRWIIAHVGSAHTEAELGCWSSRGRGSWWDNRGQRELELGIEPVAPMTTLIGATRAVA
jgi:hypothetical protein